MYNEFKIIIIIISYLCGRLHFQMKATTQDLRGT